MCVFYGLSLLSGFLEVGPLVYVYQQTGEPALALLAVLCYQIGNMAPGLSGKATVIASMLAVVGLVLALIPEVPGQYVILSLAVLCASAAIQSLRSVMKADAPAMVKRSMRIIGFASGFFWHPLSGLIGLVIIFGVALRHKDILPAKTAFFAPAPLTKLHWAMFFHQLHYFVYCYAVLLFACAKGGVWLALALFVISWLTYTFSPRLPFYRGNNYLTIFLAGHSFLLAVLLGLFFSENDIIRLILWALTGVGATTVFCFGKISQDDRNLPFAENAGHVIGVLLCLIVFLVSKNLVDTVSVAAVFVLVALFLMAGGRREKCSLNRLP
ncbi:hypothetical protein AGMMS49959_15530 [Planctomycetales bacterium]|nr:hypothetical protein AGMMS49959_15530 [Planctomycetales bacterium]